MATILLERVLDLGSRSDAVLISNVDEFGHVDSVAIFTEATFLRLA